MTQQNCETRMSDLWLSMQKVKVECDFCFRTQRSDTLTLLQCDAYVVRIKNVVIRAI